MSSYNGLSSEQALDDYFAAMLDETPEVEEFVEELSNDVSFAEPEPEPEPELQSQPKTYSTYAEIRADEFEVPNLEDVQKLLSQLESTNVVAELDLEHVMEQNTQDIAQVHIEEAQVETETISVETVQAEEEIQGWDLDEPIAVAAEVIAEPTPEEIVDDVVEEVVDIEVDTQVELQTEAGGGKDLTNWQSTVRSEDFQVLYFDVNGVTFAVPLDELGGIHQLTELSHLIGRPGWYLGLQTNRDNQLDVVDTAKWVMPEKLTDDSYKEAYQYIVMLGESLWGLASTELKGTELLNTDKVRWREQAGKRPWLAGMVKEKMCALIHVEALIAMLNAGLDVKALD